MICVLTHDPKFDVPVLEVALRLPGSATSGRWDHAKPMTIG
ncbi:xanthine dehydrogenase domain protein [Mycobacterium ulcerans str. Harvey]|uniref:Xanthine dehydrogenase domain protein n=1 Tax=Mycobacterium ulcerans str. Harvey TaxID=1299332 RepID=A0ABP3AQT8_MYCUL|nr:xanthine dehydrogenase domain protein [Mycobacterium ulcerans str. Harvey]